MNNSVMSNQSKYSYRARIGLQILLAIIAIVLALIVIFALLQVEILRKVIWWSLFPILPPLAFIVIPALLIYIVFNYVSYIDEKKQKNKISKTENQNQNQNQQADDHNQPLQTTTSTVVDMQKVDDKQYSRSSLLLSLIPIPIWLYTLIDVSIHINEIQSPGYSGGMATLWLPIMYYFGLFGAGCVISFFSIFLAIKGLKNKNRPRLAIASLIIKGVTVLLIIATFVVPRLFIR